MSAMPARAPRATPSSMPKRARGHLTRVKPLVLDPIIEAIPVAVPKGKASNRTFAFILCGMLVAGMLMLLAINTMAAQASFQKHELQIELSHKTADRQRLEGEVARAESPEHLLIMANRMGMVPAATPVFLRLSDHKILGKRVAAGEGN